MPAPMGEIKSFRPVKCFVAMIATEPSLFEKVESKLISHFGPIDLRSADYPFRYTDYYAKEMGTNLSRRFLSFKELRDPQALAQDKIFSNRLEENYFSEQKRQINIDPGYLNEAKLVLASTKDNAHRIALSDGIFAETTLLYDSKIKKYSPLRWTYPDFASGDYEEFLQRMRESFRAAFKS